jgi:heat shock protein HslJ
MRTVKPSRRVALKLSAAIGVLCLFGAGHDAVSAQTSAPAQIPGPAAPPASVAPPAGTDLQGSWLWQRTELGDGTTITSPNPSAYVLALLADGRLNIRADCNQGTGTYTTSGTQLTLQPGAITLAACGPGSQDSVFLRDLGRVASYTRDGENLVLSMQIDSGNMYFTPQPQASLTGVPWRVQSVNNGRGGVASVVVGTRLSVTFGDDGIVSGETGCNAFRGSYTVTGTTIELGQLITTRRACTSEAAGAQEQAFLAALASSTHLELSGDRLTLRNDAGSTQIILVR